MIETTYHPDDLGVNVSTSNETGEVVAREILLQVAPDHIVRIPFSPVGCQRMIELLGYSAEDVRRDREQMEARAQIEVARPGMVPQGARLPR